MKNIVNPFSELYRICDTGTNNEKYELIKNGMLNLPRFLDVELTNICNFRCCFCPTGTNSMNRTRGYMPDSVMDKLVENVEKYKIKGVRVIGWGEPTLHPKWLDFLSRVKHGGALVHFCTNGSLVSEEQMKELVNIGIDSVKFSFQGADADSYNEMREGGDYNKLVKVVKMMNKLRGENLRPFIQVSTTLTSETREQSEKFRLEIEKYCDYCNIGYTMLNHLSVDTMKISEKRKIKIRQFQHQESINREYRKVCSDAFDKLDIHWNGDAVLCCSDYDNFMVVGNILDMDIEQIFTSNAANLYRDIISKGEYGKIKCCSTCWETVPLTS